MKNIRYVFSLITLVSVFVISCNQQNYQTLEPDSIKSSVYDLDTTIQINFIPLPEEYGQTLQETFDSAKVIWESFVSLCMNDKFKDAYDCFNDYQGYFIVALKHSTNRYFFYNEVIKPMVIEFNEEEKALKEYIDILQFEYQMEVATMNVNADKDGYIPQSLPLVITDLGIFLTLDDRIDDAFKLIENYSYAMVRLTDNSAYTNMSVSRLVSTFYDLAGEIELAIKTLENYKSYTDEHRDPNRDEEEYEDYYSQIDELIEFEKSKIAKLIDDK